LRLNSADNRFSTNRIYLLGYMGSGKSTIGRSLANELGFLFLDTDTEIEKLEGRSIAEIFKTEGEAAFRQKERQLTSFIPELDKVVISTGGGLPCYNGNMNSLIHSGLTIYLECPPELLAARISMDKNERPLHSVQNDLTTLINQIKDKLADRESVYREAHLTLPNIKDPESLVSTILTKIRGAY